MGIVGGTVDVGYDLLIFRAGIKHDPKLRGRSIKAAMEEFPLDGYGIGRMF